ncbi:MAG: hypothetical protein KME26_05905 [Oscillatoria princeps RMCB-10]|jgi:hypothetical protein|nr:hypothetical protein [Oscillatoria princeps RMCB-10]
MNYKLFMAGICAALSASLTFALKAEAACFGSTCNNKDPVKEGCTDGRVVDWQTFGSYSYGPLWNRQRRQITVVLMYSAKCKANWTKADVPSGTLLYVEESPPPQNRFGRYTTQTIGWSYGNMSNGYVTNRGCAEVPGSGRYCTEFK